MTARMRARKLSRPALFVLAHFAVAIGPASGADDATCDRYAGEAVSERAQRAASLCGYSGPEWGTDPVRHYAGHLNWCLAARNESVAAAARYRNDAIAKCERCLLYAAVAVVHHETQTEWNCGWSGPAWTSDRQGHLGWCLAARDTSVLDEENKRALAMLWCSNCRTYADRAVEQANKQQTSCRLKLGGGAWTTDRGQHLRWCLDQPMHSYAALDAETRYRDKRLESCVVASTTQGLRTGSQPAARKPAGKAATSAVTGPVAKEIVTAPCRDARGNPCQPATVIVPGLLDSGQGLTQQGPAKTGIPSAMPGASAPPPTVDSLRLR